MRDEVNKYSLAFILDESKIEDFLKIKPNKVQQKVIFDRAKALCRNLKDETKIK